MFKGEYQGGPFVDVFSAQGRDPLSKKCKVTGSSTNIHKEYDKDIKSYVYVLEGEPTTTKIQFPKEDKHGLFLTQKYLVFQLFLPVGRPFSFEVAVTDHAQNKHRIFFSSNLRDISVTPLHAKFPLAVLNLGSWLNMCLDLDSLVSETFNGPKFRAIESFTVTANCRLKKVFTLRSPPKDTTYGQNNEVSYADSEPLPRNLQLITTNVSVITQILSYGKLHSKPNENPTTPITTPITTPSTPDKETHIAFGTKIVIPDHARKNSVKEHHESNKVSSNNSRLSSSRKRHGQSAPGVQYDDSIKSPLSPKGSRESKTESSDSGPTSIDADQAIMQPRPPRTSSAGKIRRPIRLKPSSAGKVRTIGKTEKVKDKEPETSAATSEVLNLEHLENADTAIDKAGKPSVSKSRYTFETEKGSVSQGNIDGVQTESTPGTTVKTSFEGNDAVNCNFEDKLKTMNINGERSSQSCITNMEKPTTIQRPANEIIEGNLVASSGSNTDASRQEPLKTNGSGLTENHDVDHISGKSQNFGHSENEYGKIQQIQQENGNSSDEHVTELYYSNMNNSNSSALSRKSVNKSSSNNVAPNRNIDMNNNDELPDRDREQPRSRPHKLPLASNNPVFTFASTPRSPRSSKRKLLDSPMVENVVTPSAEAAPEVIVSLSEDTMVKDPPVKNGGHTQRSRGVSLDDDFCKLSDDDIEEEGDGIQKLLQSSLSPRHSPTPSHHQLRQSIRSSMLKEIPSPVKENGYDAQNYQSANHLDTLDQSTASSWRFDTSDSSNSFNHTQQNLEDSLNDDTFPIVTRHISAFADIPMVDDNDEDGHSDCSDDTTYSTWGAPPPRDLRGNKYQNEMKPPGQEPDLTATICIDPRDDCDVFSPPIILGTPNKENNSVISNLSSMKSPTKYHGVNHQESEEELDLLYDPCLNCYFDPKTHKYYELA